MATGAVAASKAAWDQVRAVEDGSFALRAYEKDASKVNQILSELVAYARSDMGVLFQRQDLFKAASNLRGFGEEADKVTDRVKILSKGVALGMTNFDELSQIVGRAAQAGKLTAEQYDQLAYRGIILDSSLRGAAVGADELYNALDKALPDDILKGRADTIQGRLIRLQSAFRDVGAEILGVDRETSKFIEGGLGDRFVNGLTWATEALRQLPPIIQALRERFQALKLGATEVGAAIWDYLGPKIIALWNVIQNQLIPVWLRLWNEVIRPLLPVIGGALVVAIGLAIDAFRLLMQTGLLITRSWLAVIGFFTRTLPNALSTAWQAAVTFVQGVLDWFGQLPRRVAAFLSNMVSAIINWFNQARSNAVKLAGGLVAGVVALIASLPGRVASIISGLWGAAAGAFGNFSSRAIGWARGVVNSIVGAFVGLGSRISGAIGNAISSASSAVDNFVSAASAKISGVSSKATPKGGGGGWAVGTNFAHGDTMLVGERGPELVTLPRGSQVTQAYRTQQAASQASPSQVIVNITGPVSFNDRSDIDYFAERISKTQRLAKVGMA